MSGPITFQHVRNQPRGTVIPVRNPAPKTTIKSYHVNEQIINQQEREECAFTKVKPLRYLPLTLQTRSITAQKLKKRMEGDIRAHDKSRY